jgi:hypothetical protein
MSCKSLLLLGALMFGTMRVAAAPLHACPEVPTPTATVVAPLPPVAEPPAPAASATCEARPGPEAYTMTIYNGPRAVQKVWARECGSWRSYKVVPDCRPCGTSARRCAAEAPCVRRRCF